MDDVRSLLACSRRSDSRVRAKNNASQRARKNEGRLRNFARALLSERLEQARSLHALVVLRVYNVIPVKVKIVLLRHTKKCVA